MQDGPSGPADDDPHPATQAGEAASGGGDKAMRGGVSNTTGPGSAEESAQLEAAFEQVWESERQKGALASSCVLSYYHPGVGGIGRVRTFGVAGR